MKHLTSKISKAIVAGFLLATAQVSFAQTTVETTTTNSAGTITEFGPETMIIRSETSPEPVRYSYSKTTTYVDETGAPVSLQTVKSGLPVTVYYTRNGDRLMASKVVVRRAVAPSTTIVTTPAVPAPVVIEKRTTTTTTTDSK